MKLPISHLPCVLVYIFIYYLDIILLLQNISHEYSQILIKTVEINEKYAEKSRGCTYKSNSISITKCPRVPKIVSEYDQEIPITNLRQPHGTASVTWFGINAKTL